MKNLILTIAFAAFSNPALAATCPSIDGLIAKRDQGQATNLDVLKAMDCALTPADKSQPFPCDSVIGIRTDIVHATSELFNVGEVTQVEVDKTIKDLEEIINICTR